MITAEVRPGPRRLHHQGKVGRPFLEGSIGVFGLVGFRVSGLGCIGFIGFRV